MEPLILETGGVLSKKLSESGENIDCLFKNVENNINLEDFSIQVGVLPYQGLLSLLPTALWWLAA
jgi:hypothetical protein